MTSPKKAKIEYDDDLPLDLSIKKIKQPEIVEVEEEEDEDDEDLEECCELMINPDLKTIRQTLSSSPLDESGIFIVPAVPPLPLNISEKLLTLEWSLSEKLRRLQFQSPVEYVYNPIEYAFDVHAKYVRKYCQNIKKILFLGMNPGPWGMAQTGIPFGEVNMVRDWLQVTGFVGKPLREQPDRKVTGFSCTRSEISGRRFWNLFKELCGVPDNFFRYSYLHNYCPIALMDAKGRNITPAELKGLEQKNLHSACDEALVAAIRLLRVDIVVGIGRFAEKRAQTVVKTAGLPTQILCIPHPSPRSLGNENWSDKAAQKLGELNLLRYFTNLNVIQKLRSNKIVIMMDINEWMSIALEKATEALESGEVPVGCLFVYGNEIVASGRNTVNETKNATRHAELNCIDDVLKYCENNNLDHRNVFSNVTVIVTVEPCIMCAAALHQLKIKSIVYGCQNDRFGGCKSVFNVPDIYDNDISITGNVRGEDALQLLKDFYKGTNPNAPISKVKKGRKKKVDKDNSGDL